MPLQRVYASRDLTQAHFVRGLLDAQGISARVMGDMLPELTGALPVGALPSVWINSEDMDRAAAIVADFENAPADPQPAPPKSPWKCPNCQEVIERQFTACWRCQTPRPADGQPADPPVPVSADPTLQTDLLCIQCQYNLRGLTPAHQCPECGLPILRSVLDALRDGMPPEADGLERVLSHLFDAAARTIGYPADALISVCRAWMHATQPLDPDEPAPTKPADIAALTCVRLRDEAISCFGDVRDARAGLHAWAIHGSDQIGQIIRGLMDAGLLQPATPDATEAFNGLCDLNGLFNLTG